MVCILFQSWIIKIIMFKHEDSYLNQLEQRANRLLKDSSDEDDIYNRNTIDSTREVRKNIKNKNWSASKYSNSPTVFRESQAYENQNLEINNRRSQIQEIALLKDHIRELELQNELLKRANKNEINQQDKNSKVVKQEVSKFKKQMKQKLQDKFSSEMQVWIKKVKKIDEQKQKQKQLYTRALKEKDKIIEEAAKQKKILLKKIKKLNSFILRQVPTIVAQLKADCLLVDNCISKYYPE